MNLHDELTARVARCVQRGHGMKLTAWELRELWRDVKPRPWWMRLFSRRTQSDPKSPCELCGHPTSIRSVRGGRQIWLCGVHLQEDLALDRGAE